MFLNGRIDKCGMLIEVILKVRNFSGNEIQDQKQNKTKKNEPNSNKTNKQTITIQSNSGADWKQNQKNVLKIKING